MAPPKKNRAAAPGAGWGKFSAQGRRDFCSSFILNCKDEAVQGTSGHNISS